MSNKIDSIISLINQKKIYWEWEAFDILKDFKYLISSFKINEFTDSLFYSNEKFMKKLLLILRENRNYELSYNVYEQYFNYFIKVKDFKKARVLADNILEYYKWTWMWENSSIDLNNRMLDIENLLSIKNDILDDFNKEKEIIFYNIDKERINVVEIIVIFIAITWFLFSNITILTNISDFEKAKDFLFLIFIVLFSFPIFWFLIQSDWKDKNNQFKICSLFILLTIMISCLLYFLF